jgi:dUTP pyrophosphatase
MQEKVMKFVPQETTGLMVLSEGGCNELLPQTGGSAGIDLIAAHVAVVEFGNITIIDTKAVTAIPHGFCGMVCSRSGLAAKHGIMVVNAPGIIDSDYRDTIKVILTKVTQDPSMMTIYAGDRIAQLLFVPVAVPDINVDKERSGGLGSTGT